MHAVQLVQRLHQHRQWVNAKLLDAAQKLSVEQLHQRFEIGQGSVWKTLTHLYAAEYVWLQALNGNENPVAPGDRPGKLPGNQEADDAAASLSELKARWASLDTEWNTYLADLTDDSLTQLSAKVSSLSGQRSTTARGDILLHLCTHAQYTVAQAVNMMRHAGLDRLPDPMFITMAREESAAGG